MDSATTWTIGTVIFLIVGATVLLALSVRLVKQHERAVVFRLGRTSPDLVCGPGLRFAISVMATRPDGRSRENQPSGRP